jgi:3D-(3,5/4)-trihydroxycyclohexane-1,2-dione acylhydrolase (decyclizing)
LTEPADTGAACLALPQDVQAEAWDYPQEFFEKRVHYIERRELSRAAASRAADIIANSKKPMIVCGGGVKYSEAGETLASFCREFTIPFGETQAGKSAIDWDHPMNLGGMGVTGGQAANEISAEADLIIAVGTRLSDFTTGSKWSFKNEHAKFLSLNVNAFDAYKMNSHPFICDARKGLEALREALTEKGWRSAYSSEIEASRKRWEAEVDRLYSEERGPNGLYSQLRALGIMNEEIFDPDDIIVGASGSLPGDLQRLWRSRHKDSYHMEYGFSCMGYEVSGAVGAKLAAPDQEVYSMTGDASFVMLHSEILTAIQEGVKINIMLFDNNGFGCIDNLQRSQGIPKFGCELRYRNPRTGLLDQGGELIPVDYAKIAEGYGCRTWTVRNSDELRRALSEAKESPVTTLIDIKVDWDSMSDGYLNWWRVGTPEVSKKESVLKANAELRANLATVRQY